MVLMMVDLLETMKVDLKVLPKVVNLGELKVDDLVDQMADYSDDKKVVELVD